jgi:hypothetical protein
VCDVQRAVISSGEHAGGQGLTGIDFRQDSTGAAGGGEDLGSEFAGDVVAADFIDGHSVTFGDLNVWRSFAEFEFAILVNRKTHGHRRHFDVINSEGAVQRKLVF